jgi:hypothetical protein
LESDAMPQFTPEKSDELFELDPNLRPDEESYVNHYLKYADVLLRETNVTKMPPIEERFQHAPETEDEEKDGEAA